MRSLLNKKAPSLTLMDQNGTPHSLDLYKGKYVLLYFYPKDLTPGCTVEAQGFRDRATELKKLNVQVLGVSADSIDLHKKFCDKHDLNFPLLSDESKGTLKKYGVWVEKSMYGKKYMGIQRDSFLIDPDGKIVKHYVKVKPPSHPDDVIQDVKALRK